MEGDRDFEEKQRMINVLTNSIADLKTNLILRERDAEINRQRILDILFQKTATATTETADKSTKTRQSRKNAGAKDQNVCNPTAALLTKAAAEEFQEKQRIISGVANNVADAKKNIMFRERDLEMNRQKVLHMMFKKMTTFESNIEEKFATIENLESNSDAQFEEMRSQISNLENSIEQRDRLIQELLGEFRSKVAIFENSIEQRDRLIHELIEENRQRDKRVDTLEQIVIRQFQLDQRKQLSATGEQVSTAIQTEEKDDYLPQEAAVTATPAGGEIAQDSINPMREAIVEEPDIAEERRDLLPVVEQVANENHGNEVVNEEHHALIGPTGCEACIRALLEAKAEVLRRQSAEAEEAAEEENLDVRGIKQESDSATISSDVSEQADENSPDEEEMTIEIDGDSEMKREYLDVTIHTFRDLLETKDEVDINGPAVEERIEEIPFVKVAPEVSMHLDAVLQQFEAFERTTVRVPLEGDMNMELYCGSEIKQELDGVTVQAPEEVEEEGREEGAIEIPSEDQDSREPSPIDAEFTTHSYDERELKEELDDTTINNKKGRLLTFPIIVKSEPPINDTTGDEPMEDLLSVQNQANCCTVHSEECRNQVPFSAQQDPIDVGEKGKLLEFPVLVKTEFPSNDAEEAEPEEDLSSESQEMGCYQPYQEHYATEQMFSDKQIPNATVGDRGVDRGEEISSDTSDSNESEVVVANRPGEVTSKKILPQKEEMGLGPLREPIFLKFPLVVKEEPMDISETSTDTEPQDNMWFANENGGSQITASEEAVSSSSSSSSGDLEVPETLECAECSLSFTSKYTLIKHVFCHIDGVKPPSYVCETCGEVLATKLLYNAHIQICQGLQLETDSVKLNPLIITVGGHKEFQCEICGKSFSKLPLFRSHSYVHSTVKRFKCATCKKSFSHPGSLRRHTRIHTGDKPHTCQVCKKSFLRAEALQSHTRTHTGDKPYKCDICNKTLAHQGGLISHKRTHLGVKPFKCETCGKTFSYAQSLVYHNNIHLGLKPFECKICGKSFSNPANLSAHRLYHNQPNQ